MIQLSASQAIPRAGASQAKRRVLFYVRLAVSLGLVSYLGWILDWEQAVQAVSAAGKSLLLVVPFLMLVRLGAAVCRWKLILADSAVRIRFWQGYTSYLVGAFYNVLLPGVTGGDAVRVGRCVAQTRCKLGTATASVLLERVSGVFALSALALSTYLLFPKTLLALLGTGATSAAVIVAALGIIVIVTVILARRLWSRWLPAEDAGRFWRFVRSGMQTLSTLRGRTLGVIVALSIVFQAVDILATFLLSRALGLEVSLSVFFGVLPLVYLVICLPVSLGGLGVREGALVFLLSRFGVAASDAVMLSFLLYLNRIVIGSLGGFAQLAEVLSSREINRVAGNRNHG